jgi:hypothetical protein
VALVLRSGGKAAGAWFQLIVLLLPGDYRDLQVPQSRLCLRNRGIDAILVRRRDRCQLLLGPLRSLPILSNYRLSSFPARSARSATPSPQPVSCSFPPVFHLCLSPRVCNRKTFGPSEDHKTTPGMRVAPGIPQRPRDLPTSHQEDPTGLLGRCSASALTPTLCAVCGGVGTGPVGLVEPGVRIEGQEN